MQTLISSYPNIRHTLIYSDRSGPFSSLKEQILSNDIPLGAFFHVYMELYRQAASKGVRTILTGLGGDILASYSGFGTGLASVRANGIGKAISTLQRIHSKHSSTKSFFFNEIALPAMPRFLKTYYREHSKRSIARRIEDSTLNADFIASTDILNLCLDHRDFIQRSFKSNQHRVASSFDSGRKGSQDNQWFKINGTETLRPLEDLRLIEFCLSIPHYHYSTGKLHRGLYREALRGILPDTIRNRPNKSAFIPSFHKSVRAEANTIESLVNSIDSNHEIWRIVDKTKFRSVLNKDLKSTKMHQMGNWDTSIQLHVFPVIAYAKMLDHKSKRVP